jgi:inhibitor of cysteine peptidase
MENKATRTLTLLASFGIAVVIIAALLVFKDKANFKNLLNNPIPGNLSHDTRLKTFTSQENFKEYLAIGNQSQNSMFYGIGSREAAPTALEMPLQKTGPGLGSSADTFSSARYSETNVQVKGIDEPDVVKTDGKKIYYSNGLWDFYGYGISEPMVRESTSVDSKPTAEIAPDRAILPPQQSGKVSILNANPLASEGKIDIGGELLLSGNILVSVQSNKLVGFDVGDPKSPKQTWSSAMESSQVVATRLKDGKLYIVTQTYLNSENPCPIPLMKVNGGTELTIACTDIYHPYVNVGVDTTYTAMEMNLTNGEVSRKVSFVGQSGQSVVYVSENAMYVTYSYPGDYVTFFYGFLAERGADLVPGNVLDKLSNLRGYDISTSTKIQEIQVILNQYKATLQTDDQLKFDTELQNRMQEYGKGHARELENTGIVKVGLANMSVDATGGVPGHPLTQFSLDEYDNHLRIATTSTGSFLVSVESVNDLYVLDSSLKASGSILDMGKGERIFSARFIGNKGYIVTFKQIDPFYVLDLADHNNPKKAGELKIPGFSSYLHPLTDNLILGVGQEEGNVKVSLFNVADPSNPTEINKYNLNNEFWTEVQNNHHAFLQDADNQVFFLPGGQGGYVFSYKDNAITLAKAINKPGVKRAIYIGNNLYVFSDREVTVYDENNWQQVNSLSL